MSNNKWDEEYIEQLLGDFPSIKDERSKEEVYSRLAKKAPVKKRPKNWLPLLVAALAFITVGILVASIVSQNGINSAVQEEQSSADKSAESVIVPKEESGEADKSAGSENSSSDSFSAMAGPEQMRTALYKEDLNGATVFSIGLTENAFVVPVSFLVPSEQIARDFGKDVPDSVALYNHYAGKLDEQALGFDDYHPYAGTIARENDAVAHRLPDDHPYDQASASISVYESSIQETFQDAEEVAVLNEDGSQAEFDQIGPMEPIKTDMAKVAYFAYTASSGATYLVPSYGMPYETAKEAIEALTTSPSDFHHATIAEGTGFAVTETDAVLELAFSEPFDFESQDLAEATRMVESIALTAQSFGKQVQLKNTVQEQWNGFDFTQPIPAPAEPNRLEWPLE
ncbi:GerMN domain-containing protein [Planococcus sp. YIM B11945]|uniref:GerMN domain-containing protein n=1 Tax=Planococcus sp. YIM B11945 TaxID=3435410 RepID=UPI003D7C69EF